METNETFLNEEEQPTLELDLAARNFLFETSKWSNFLAILGFIVIGLIILVGIILSIGVHQFMSDSLPSQKGFFYSNIWLIYLVMAAVYFLPVYYLYKFSTKVKTAIRNLDSYELTESFRFLKKHYKFVGVMTIIMLIYTFLMFGFSLLRLSSVF